MEEYNRDKLRRLMIENLREMFDNRKQAATVIEDICEIHDYLGKIIKIQSGESDEALLANDALLKQIRRAKQKDSQKEEVK